jgi:hypothetical protein
VGRNTSAACGNSSRGIFGGGHTGAYSNVMDYITIASIGNATDFGDLIAGNNTLSSCASVTRGLFGGGYLADDSKANTIEYITIATTGNAVDFGDLTAGRYGLAACSGD